MMLCKACLLLCKSLLPHDQQNAAVPAQQMPYICVSGELPVVVQCCVHDVNAD